MAKYEIEIDEATAMRWSVDPCELAGVVIPERVIATLEELVRRYGSFPRIAGKKEEAAIAICRAIAAERAAAFGARPHDGSIERVAADILDFMLGEY